jgi:SAM-dependent methyltransferase
MADDVYPPEYFQRRAASPLFDWEVRCLGHGARDKELLEVGSGSGELARRLRAAEIRSYTTSDVVAQTGEPPDVLCGAEDLPFAAGAFDIVVAQHVVEHLVDPRRFFTEAYRVLRPGGYLRFTTPNAAYHDPTIFADPTHVSVHGMAEWRGMLAGCGFEVTKLTSYFPYLGHARLLYTSARLTLRTRLRVGKGAVIFAEART